MDAAPTDAQLRRALYDYDVPDDASSTAQRATPYSYYYGMLVDSMLREQHYDALPNFTAADIVRVLGIGRNQYIDAMNAVRAGSSGWNTFGGEKKQRALIAALLPERPLADVPVQFWWQVRCAAPDAAAVQASGAGAAEQRVLTELLGAAGVRKAGGFEYETLQALYAQQLVFFDVPVAMDDVISIPPLEGFIMNRGAQDDLEKLLYDVFVSHDEHSTVGQLATVLGAEPAKVCSAISLSCRLGFVRKRVVDDMGADVLHASWLAQDRMAEVGAYAQEKQLANSDGSQRIGFLFDSSLTAFLMMGNLSASLKSHAVTLFEVGKLADESLDDFLSELEKVEETVSAAWMLEGEAQRYLDHALNLRETLRFLRRNSAFELGDGGVDMLHYESLHELQPSVQHRVLLRNYAILVSMAPTATLTLANAEGKLPPYFGPPSPVAASPWFRIWLYDTVASGPFSILFLKGERVCIVPHQLNDYDRILCTTWDVSADASVVQPNQLLSFLNDALTKSPLLVQGYSPTGGDGSSPTMDVAFPSGAPAHAEDDDLLSREGAHATAVARQVAEKLNLLNSVGFVRLVRAPTAAGATAWVPLDVCFGLPLFDSELNADVCASVLFTADNIERHAENSAQLCKALDKFVLDSGGVLGSATLPMPTRQLRFAAAE